MGTFSDSKIVTARNPYFCDKNNAHVIRQGDRYLRYKLGQRNDRRICMTCAVHRDMGDGPLTFDCNAVRALVGTTSTTTENK